MLFSKEQESGKKNFGLGLGRGAFGPRRGGQLQIRAGPPRSGPQPHVYSFSPLLPPSSAFHGCRDVPGRRPVPGAAGGLHRFQTCSLGREPGRSPPLPPCSRPRAARLPARCLGSRGSRARQPERGRSRAQGLAFVALKTFQRACHGDAQQLGRSPRGPRLPRGTFRRSAALSLSLSDAPPPGLALPELPPSLPARTFPGARGSRPRRRSALALPRRPAASPRRCRRPAAPRLAFQNGPAPSRALRAASAAPSPGRPPERGAGSGERGAGEEGTRREGLAASFEPTFRQWSKATCPSRLPQRRRRWRRRSRWNCWRPRLPRRRSERPHR